MPQALVLRAARWVIGPLFALVAPLGASPLWAADDAAPPRLLAAATALADLPPLSATQRERLARYQAEPTTADVTAVRFHAAALRGRAAVTLNLPGQEPTVLDQIETRAAAAGRTTWSGRASNGLVDAADTTLVLSGEDVFGTIRANGRLFAVRPLGSGVQALIELDERRFPPEHPPGALPRAANGAALAPRAAPSADTAAEYRVIVAYTAAAKRAVGDIGALIQLAVTETNRGYANSGVTTRAVLAHAYQTPLTESSSMSTDLYRFQRSGDGAADEIHRLRDQHKGDVAVLISAHRDYCGIAFLNASASYAFGVVSHGCATGYYSFAHEIGHLQGARHNPEVDPSSSPFAYGHGYYNTSGRWRTIMSYECPVGCRRVNHWSNPNISYLGSATGTAARHHNARVLNETASRVANFRVSTP
jgi:hypothetical protein